MSFEFGTALRLRVYGASHAPCVGVEITGLPAGEAVDDTVLQHFLDRRRPGRSALTTSRKEADRPQFLSGLRGGVTTGGPLRAEIPNLDAHPEDYTALADTPRPGHADYTARLKYGHDTDLRGGGVFSGRMTAPLCIAGGIAKQILARRNIHIGAHLASVGNIPDDSFPVNPDKALLERLASREFPTLSNAAGNAMQEEILRAKSEGDSVGGVIACAAIGVPAGLGGPLFQGLEGRLAQALFAIPAVKGVDFGDGFHAAALRGSAHNDPYTVQQGKLLPASNHAGGILGGITTGMPVTLRVAVKPTPSIAKPQKTVRLSRMEETTLTLQGRHDPCVALRAVPVVEAMTAVVLLDLLLEESHGTV